MPTRCVDNKHLITIVPVLIVLILIVGCEGGQPAPTPVPPTATLVLPAASPMPPTATPVSEATPTVPPLPALTGSGGGVIAFASDRDGNYEIYVMNADGTDQRWLTNHGAREGFPAWSPNGTRIAFMSERNGNGDIYVMAVPGGTDADGAEQGSGDPQRLTEAYGHDEFPTWSPNGSLIAFESDRSGNEEIYVMNADGSDQRCLTNNPAQDYGPDWRP